MKVFNKLVNVLDSGSRLLLEMPDGQPSNELSVLGNLSAMHQHVFHIAMLNKGLARLLHFIRPM
jgi:hypothetical protein